MIKMYNFDINIIVVFILYIFKSDELYLFSLNSCCLFLKKTLNFLGPHIKTNYESAFKSS